ncbi:hypothetical protein NDU88_003541 [Pleurodeles waltl]|uniref:Uncharacterized protein n=1 Tax=Pleurodeles waltl TaxID=8319 RepID=A0AAV7PEY2_PLEWA|nr:hypothetical protein NDU88_003541 [Pleurodeles waltl]
MSKETGETEALTQHTEVILAAIQDSTTALESQIAMLAGEVGLLRSDHKKLKDRVKATEVIMWELTPQVKTLAQKLALMGNECIKSGKYQSVRPPTRWRRELGRTNSLVTKCGLNGEYVSEYSYMQRVYDILSRVCVASPTRRSPT